MPQASKSCCHRGPALPRIAEEPCESLPLRHAGRSCRADFARLARVGCELSFVLAGQVAGSESAFQWRGKEFGCGVPVGSWVYGSCSRVGERLESFDEVGKPFVVEREAVLHLRCERHELASDLKEEALKILELTNRLFEERIVVSDAPATPTSWIAISDEQGQIVSDKPAHDCHFG
jgi:hypothetical protein